MTRDEMGVRLDLFELPLRRAWVSRRGSTASRWSLLVQVQGEGITGLGEAALPLRVDNPLVLARDAASRLPRLRVDEVWAARRELDHAGVPDWLRHGVMAALADHAARTRNVSLAMFLADSVPAASVRVEKVPGESIRVNGNAGPGDESATVKQARELVDAGFRTIKVKSLGDARVDARRLASLRETLGGDVALRLDVNGAWRPEEAMEALKRLQPYALEYVEEPLETGTLKERARFAGKSPVPVAWDESVTGPVQAKELAPTAAALVVKPPRLGGVDRLLPVLAVARDADTPVVVSTPLEGAVGRAVDLQLAALVPHETAHGLATGAELSRDLAEPAPVPENGRIVLPHTAGIGALRITREGLSVSGGDARSG